LTLTDAAHDQRYHDLITQGDQRVAGHEMPEAEPERFAADNWFGAERGGLRDANGREGVKRPVDERRRPSRIRSSETELGTAASA
jgi:hypothetical protein